jgi:DNA-binding helix-hairpin-helix protein with protein kinase domain
MVVSLHDGSTVTCDDEPFASGKDGAAHWSADGTRLVKLYHSPEPWRAATLDAVLDRFNAVKDDAYWAQYLCWPLAVVRAPRLGVLLPRAADGLRKLDCFTVPKWLQYHPEDLGSLHGRLGIAIKVARAVKRLHFKGLCHSDLSGNNVLANPHDGRAYVIDCDGLVVPDQPIARPVVDGTAGWMAPELVAGAVDGPSVATERHSLAVLIYQTLLLRHPLHGGKQHDPSDGDRDESLRMGERALFIEHPSDTSNRPLWFPYPFTALGSALGRLVRKAFVDGLHDAGERPSPAEWERDLCRLADMLVPCLNPSCTYRAFPFPEGVQGRSQVRCPWCGTAFGGFALPVLHWHVPVPGQVGVYRQDGTRMVAWPDTALHQWHVRPHVLPGPGIDGAALASFQRFRGADGAERWCLVNRALPYLEAADPGAGWKPIRAAEAVQLKHGRKLRFGPPGTARDAVVQVVELT